MKKIITLILLLVSFLLGCVSSAPETEGLSEEELAALPSDLQPQKSGALAGQAIYERCVDPDAVSTFDQNQLLVRSTTTFEGGSRTDRCYTWYMGTPRERTRLIEGTCRAGRFLYWYADCSAGSRCQEGACVTLSTAPTISIEGEASPRVEVIPSGTSVLVEANDVLVLEAPAAENLGDVTITTGTLPAGGAAVVVTGLEGVEHYVYVPNTRNGGVFSCPSGRTIAETIPTCSDVITHSYADCVAGIGGCSIVGSQYRVVSSGSSHGELTVCGLRCDGDLLINETESCEPLPMGTYILIDGTTITPTGMLDCRQSRHWIGDVSGRGRYCVDASDYYSADMRAACLPCNTPVCVDAEGRTRGWDEGPGYGESGYQGFASWDDSCRAGFSEVYRTPAC